MAHDPHRYDPAASGHNFVQWSPYADIELPYRPVATFLRGKMIYDGKHVLAEPGSGAFVRPPFPVAHMQEAQLMRKPPIDSDRLWNDLMALAAITDPDKPYTRRSFSPLFLKGRDWLEAAVRAGGAHSALRYCGQSDRATGRRGA